MIRKRHHFYTLTFNSFASLRSISFFNILFSIILFFKQKEIFSLLLNLSSIVWCGILWWICYRREFRTMGSYNFCLEEGLKFSFILFIGSEIFFFLSFFWSYFSCFLSPSIDGSFSWPPVRLEIFDYDKLPLVNTLILLLSGVRITIAHNFLIIEKKGLREIFLLITFTLGFLFSLLQVTEYGEGLFSINDGRFGRVFFILTGFHGIHVIIGSFFLSFVFFKFVLFNSSSPSSLSFDLSAWYWHFVDVIWVFLFYFVYYLNF